MKKAGWKIVHLPTMTILHHAGKAGISAKMEAQNAVAKMHYARKHFGRSHRLAFDGALLLRYALRAAAPARGELGKQRRAASIRSMRTMVGLEPPPFGEPAPTAIASGSSKGEKSRATLRP